MGSLGVLSYLGRMVLVSPYALQVLGDTHVHFH